MLLMFLLSCAGDDAGPSTPAPTADTATSELEHRFSFVVVADPHVSRAGENADRLEQAVAWINAEAAARSVELVFVVGDVGWTPEGLALSRELLDELTVPYLPLLGDNEIHSGSEQGFADTFAEHYDHLATVLTDWQRGPVEAHNPVQDQTSWFQNFSFRHGGVRFVGLDWNSRDADPVLGEFAELHDFDGGTWPWFESELTGLEPTDAEDVLLFSHHPMQLGVFDLAEMDRITGVTAPVGGRVAAAFAGHLHASYDSTEVAGRYDVFVTDATWDDENTLRIVDVLGDGVRYAYTQELVVVPLLPPAR